MSAESNTCVICLEHLSTDIFGATTPCGHCFHEACFQGWSRARCGNDTSVGRHRPVSCPMCNNTTNGFHRLYLDLNDISGEDSDDDDDSDSSVAFDIDDASQSGTQTDSASEIEPSDDDEEGSSDDAERKEAQIEYKQQVIEILDDPEPSEFCNTDIDKRLKKYRRTAKLLKRHCKRLSEQQKRLVQEHNELLERHEEAKYNLAEVEVELEAVEKQSDRMERSLQQANLDNSRLGSINEELNRQLQSIKAQKLSLEAELDGCRRELEKALPKAKLASMSEVQRLLEHYPKLTEENKKLKEELKRAKQNLQKTTEDLYVFRAEDHSNRVAQKVKPIGSLSSQLRALKELDGERAQGTRNDDERRKREEKLAAMNQVKSKASEHAVRFARAKEKAQYPRGIDDVFELLTDKEPMKPSMSVNGMKKRPATFQRALGGEKAKALRTVSERRVGGDIRLFAKPR